MGIYSFLYLPAVIRTYPFNTISMCTSLGIGMRISCRSARSSASRSINRLCMRISQWSQVGEPSPSGLFLHGTRSFFVGRGMGPDILTPVVSTIFFTCWQISSNFLWSTLESFIRAFWFIPFPFPLCLLISYQFESLCFISPFPLCQLPCPQQRSAPCPGLRIFRDVVFPSHAR